MPPSSGGTRGGAPDSDDHVGRDHLTRYVKEYIDQRRPKESERSLAQRCIDPVTTLRLRHGWINDLVNGTIDRAPELRRLRALAAGMDVPVRLVVELAAAQWLELDVTEVQIAEAPAGDESWVAVTVPQNLTPEERQRFVRMAEDMAKHMGS
jgi:hypothetical protein